MNEESKVTPETSVQNALKKKILFGALELLWEEYQDRKSQFGDNFLWRKHEDTKGIKWVESIVKESTE